MFRFPKGLLDEADLEPYCVDEFITFESIGQYQVLDLDFNPEDSGGWIETEAGLSDFVSLCADLLEGDFRLLYLAWLKAMTIYGDLGEDEYEKDGSDSPIYDLEPPVPPGLKNLSPALDYFVKVFEIDPFLVQAAAEASPDPKRALAADCRDLVSRLSRSECDDFLIRIAEGDSSVGLALRKRLGVFIPKEQPQAPRSRTIQQLLERAEELKKAEAKRQAEAARRNHIAEMKALAAREAETWQQVDTLLEKGRKIASLYDEATALLEKLQHLSEFQDTQDVFKERLGQLAQKYSSRPSLIRRREKHGWI